MNKLNFSKEMLNNSKMNLFYYDKKARGVGMNRCLIIMPMLFMGGSEKQVRLIIDGIEKEKLPLTVIVESNNKDMHALEKEFIISHPNTDFIFMNSSAAEAKYSNTIRKYSIKFVSVFRLMICSKKIIKKKHINKIMITNLTGLVLVPWFNFLGCDVIYNERNSGIKVCDSTHKKWLLQKCSILVCNSGFASKIMESKLHKKVEIINNGINMTNKINKPFNDGIFRVIVPARISEIKNQLTVLKAIEKLKDEICIKVTFAGAVEDKDYYKILNKFIEEKGLNKYVEFVGFISDLNNYYENSNLLILPSYEEGTPNVLLEAYTFRLPVLASDTPMNNDCAPVKEFLFETENADELAKKIKQISLLENDELKIKLDKNFNFVTQNFNIEKMQDRYLRLIYNWEVC